VTLFLLCSFGTMWRVALKHPNLYLIALKIADGDEKPTMLERMANIELAKEKLTNFFSSRNRLLKPIVDIIETKWLGPMEPKLHGAALLLNPNKFFSITGHNVDLASSL
jgi:hypothetical protein